LFLFARGTNNSGEIPFADIDAIARDQQISEPQFSGVAADGSIIEITAKAAKPQQGSLGTLSISEPLLTLNAVDGTSLTHGAADAIYRRGHIGV